MSNSAITLLSGTAPGAGTINPSQIASAFGSFFRNGLINSNFDFWQRATSFATPGNGIYTADRWLVLYDGTIGSFTVSRQAFTVGQTAVPNEPEYFYRWNHTSAGSASTLRQIIQRIEGVRTLAGKQMTFTCWMKADSARNVTISLLQNFGGGGSASVPTTGATFALTASWQKLSVTVTLPSISGKTVGTLSSLGVVIDLPLNTTMTIDLAQAQLEEYEATPYQKYPKEIELARCLRYYQIVPTAVASTSVTIPFKAPMAGTPTVAGGGTGFATTTLTANGGSCSQTALADQALTLEAEL